MGLTEVAFSARLLVQTFYKGIGLGSVDLLFGTRQVVICSQHWLLVL
jgi:hypothetical protein